MKCLVTGGAGFIGSHLVDALLGYGHTVIVVDNFSLGSYKNLEHHKGDHRLIIYEKDIRDDLRSVFATEGISVVFHLAAIPRARYSVMRPAETHAANVYGTFNILEYCRTFGVKRFVLSSSAAIYGEQEITPLSENVSPQPVSPYALEKLIGEQYCSLFHRLYGLEAIALRYFNVYGPRQNPDGDYSCLIPKFITLIASDKRPEIYGDGEQTRDFVYVSDVIAANIKAATTQQKDCFGEVYNVGTGTQTSVNGVAQSIATVIGKSVEPIYGPAFLEPRKSCASIDKIKKHLEWNPEVSFINGLHRTYSALSSADAKLTTPYLVSR